MGEFKGHHWKKSAVSASELSGRVGYDSRKWHFFCQRERELFYWTSLKPHVISVLTLKTLISELQYLLFHH